MSTKKALSKKEKADEPTAVEQALMVLRYLQERGAIDEANSVASEDVETALAEKGFNVGHRLYSMRHAKPPLTKRGKVEGVQKAVFVLAAGKRFLARARRLNTCTQALLQVQ